MSAAARTAAVAAAVAGASAVLLGALGAHVMPARLSPRMLEVWHIAVRFQFWHALALAVLAVLRARTRAAAIATGLLVAGSVLFCGSLYALALGAPRWVGLCTPLGGVALVCGWVALGVALFKGDAAVDPPRPPTAGGNA